jgi:hypothetical protein
MVQVAVGNLKPRNSARYMLSALKIAEVLCTSVCLLWFEALNYDNFQDACAYLYELFNFECCLHLLYEGFRECAF